MKASLSQLSSSADASHENKSSAGPRQSAQSPAAAMNRQQFVSKDFYRILHISQTATAAEIKTAYYRLAKRLHPDMTGGHQHRRDQHDGENNNNKATTEDAFKQVNEAYDTLSDPNKRREYDASMGLRFRAREPHLRTERSKVYAPRPPPNWKFVWDHAKHQEMHYGDGMMKEAVKQAMKEAEEAGAFEYQSPLGKGFTFSSTTSSTEGGGTEEDKMNYNPYSKRSPQGPPKIIIEYQEGTNMGDGKERIWKRERIVHDLHSTRRERHQKQQEEEEPRRRRNSSAPERADSVYESYRMYSSDTKKKRGDCTIS
jgi:curved DNA-binding protein CbpA